MQRDGKIIKEEDFSVLDKDKQPDTKSKS